MKTIYIKETAADTYSVRVVKPNISKKLFTLDQDGLEDYLSVLQRKESNCNSKVRTLCLPEVRVKETERRMD